MCRLLSSVLFAVGVLCLLSFPAAAQVVVSPDTVAVSLAEGEAVEVVLTVTSGSAGSQPLALSLAPAPSETDPEGAPGDFLFATAPETFSSSIRDLTMTPEGQLFVAEDFGRNRTFELTPELDFVRRFEQPTTTPLSGTLGLAYRGEAGGSAGTGTLWWLDLQGDGEETEQAVLLEGTFDGTPTGRLISVPFSETTSLCDFATGRPFSLAYDPTPEAGREEGLFYYTDVWNDTIWAIDTLGAVADGYPVLMTDYPRIPDPPYNPNGCFGLTSFDAHALGGEPVFEASMGLSYDDPQGLDRDTRIVVTDREGHNRGAEMPLLGLPTPDGFGDVLRIAGMTRSRLDPSIVYLSVWTGFPGNVRDWVYAVRAVPLPPPWLRASPILFETEGEAETELTLSLDATGLEPGIYEGVVSVRDGDGIGPVLVDVPVVLTVAPVDSEDEAAEQATFALGEPYPNPSAGGVTLPVVLGAASEVRVVVFDILGREVAQLADGPLAVGTHRFGLDTAGLPAGVYVVRADSETFTVSRRVTVVH